MLGETHGSAWKVAGTAYRTEFIRLIAIKGRIYARNTAGESGYLVIRVLVTEKEMPTNEKIGRRENGRMGSHLDKRSLQVRPAGRKLV